MQITALLVTAALSAMPAAQQAAEAPPPINFDAAIAEAVTSVVLEDLDAELVWIQERDPETGRFVAGQPDQENGYFSMLYGNSYDPAVLAFFAASAIQMYSASDRRTQCGESTIVSCTDPFPSTVQQEALITAAAYAGVTGLQRLAETQWGLNMDEGWKHVVIYGSLAALLGLRTAQNMSDANALRDLGR